MNVAIIVAAGSGSRVGADKPKQFLELAGKPILFHTIEKFENCPLVDEIVLVIASEQMEYYRSLALKYRPRKVGKIVFGGRTRAESVSKGLAALSNYSDAIVAVHDGARPFVAVGEIEATIRRAAEVGAACLMAPVTDTIKEVGGGMITSTVDRTKLRRALTPQAFHIEILKSAFRDADLSEVATDECYMLEQLGFRIAIVEGNARNFKITTREDVVLAEAFLASENR